MNNDRWKDLRCAIIQQAVSDYKKLVDGDMMPKFDCNYEEIERFIDSDWCDLLMLDTDIDPKELKAELTAYRQAHEEPLNRYDAVQYFDGWTDQKIRAFIMAHTDQILHSEHKGYGYVHTFYDAQTYELRVGDHVTHTPTEIYINGKLVKRHKN